MYPGLITAAPRCRSCAPNHRHLISAPPGTCAPATAMKGSRPGSKATFARKVERPQKTQPRTARMAGNARRAKREMQRMRPAQRTTGAAPARRRRQATSQGGRRGEAPTSGVRGSPPGADIATHGKSAQRADEQGGRRRWRWDLNPRRGCPLTRFRGVRPRPLGDSTAGELTRRCEQVGQRATGDLAVSMPGALVSRGAGGRHGGWRRRWRGGRSTRRRRRRRSPRGGG